MEALERQFFKVLCCVDVSRPEPGAGKKWKTQIYLVKKPLPDLTINKSTALPPSTSTPPLSLPTFPPPHILHTHSGTYRHTSPAIAKEVIGGDLLLFEDWKTWSAPMGMRVSVFVLMCLHLSAICLDL